MALLCDPDVLRPPVNVVRMSLQEQGFGRLVRNRGQLAAALLLRVQHRAERLGDPGPCSPWPRRRQTNQAASASNAPNNAAIRLQSEPPDLLSAA